MTDKNLEAEFMRVAYSLGEKTEASFYLQDIHKRLNTLKLNKRFPG